MKKFNALLLLSLTSLMVFTACSGTPTYVGEDELGGGQVDNETGTSNTDVSDLKSLKVLLNTAYLVSDNLAKQEI